MINWNRLYDRVTPRVNIKVYLSNIQIPTDVDMIIATSWETAEVLDRIYKEHKSFKPVYFIQHIETWDYYNTGNYSANDISAWRTYDLPFTKIVTSKWIANRIRSDYIVPMGIEVVPEIDKKYFGATHGCPYISGVLRGIPWKGDDIIEKLAEEHPVNIFKNLSNELYNIMLDRTDIFLSASVAEGFNLPVLEAMNHGCCVVTTITGAIPDYSGDCTAVYPVDHNVLSFSNGLQYLRENPDEIIKMGKKARELSMEWTIERTIYEFEKVLYDI